MLETIIARQIIFYIAGAVAGVGIIAKLVAGISLKRLVKAASNMGKSNHALMKLVRAKFEHACMVSDKVQNVKTFVEKYIYEYRILGLKLHSWRRLEIWAIWLYALTCAVGVGAGYYVKGLGEEVYQCAAVGVAGVAVLLLIHHVTDEKYQFEAVKVYMVDFLENTYAHRYAKTNQKEVQVTVQKAEVPVESKELEKPTEDKAGTEFKKEDQEKEETQSEVQAASNPSIQSEGQPKNASEYEKDTPKEEKIREILEEFLS